MFRRSLTQQCSHLRVASPAFISSSRSQAIQSHPFASQWRNATVIHRWGSTEANKAPIEDTQPEIQETIAKPDAEKPTQNSELEAKNKEIIDLKDKYLRSVAEFRNLQDRTRREVQSSKDFAIQKFAKDLLESIDNLDRALTTVPKESLVEENKDLISLHNGLKMTETILMNTLEKHGLTRFDPKEEKFNPNLHEATFEVPMEGKEPGTVMHVQSKGYSLNGRVLRAAKVGVVRAA